MPGKKRSVKQIAAKLEEMSFVFRWGVESDVIPPNKVADYRPRISRDIKHTQGVTMA